MKTTEGNNRMIAEFMGASGFDMLGEKVEPKYHTSWDWLMPVVEKIESIKNEHGFTYSVRMSGKFCTVESVNYSMIDMQLKGAGNTKLQATYQAVVQFIEWYNKQK